MRAVARRTIPRHTERGSITVLAAVILSVIALLGILAWAGAQEWADHTLLGRIVAGAAYDASQRLADPVLVAGAPALLCLDSSCTPTPCAVARTRDPEGITAPGEACRALEHDLAASYTGAQARLDEAATLAATRVWVLAPGERDPEDAATRYHYPTVCLSTDATVGVLAHDGLAVRQHLHACAQAVYR